jgi:hypothetical protein
MCPDKKYQWFENNEDWRPDDREKVKEMVFKHWKDFCAEYGSTSPAVNETTPQPHPQKVQMLPL